MRIEWDCHTSMDAFPLWTDTIKAEVTVWMDVICPGWTRVQTTGDVLDNETKTRSLRQNPISEKDQEFINKMRQGTEGLPAVAENRQADDRPVATFSRLCSEPWFRRDFFEKYSGFRIQSCYGDQ